MKSTIDPEKPWVEVIQPWIRKKGGAKLSSVDLCERLRQNVACAARFASCVKAQVGNEVAYCVTTKEVLAATSGQIRSGYGVGPKTMKYLGIFLRESGLALADGWNG